MPAISVIIPTYNRSGFLLDALRSVFDQTFGDYEVLVVDDGSTDDTAERLAPHRPRIRYLRQANAGAAAARNHGIREAAGDIVGFLDADDLWEPSTLRRVAAAFGDGGPGYVSIMAREVRANGERTARIYGKKSPGSRYTTAGLLREDCGGCSWFFVRRAVLQAVGGYDESLSSAEEIDLCLRLSFVTEMTALREPLLLRRKHPGNLSDDLLLNARMWIRILHKFEREHPDFVAANPRVFRRTLAKERLRLGRELLARCGAEPGALAEARRTLGLSAAASPLSRRALTYLAWSWLAPRTYAGWRSRQLEHRHRS